jgi:flagellar motor switch protein FliN/FliY
MTEEEKNNQEESQENEAIDTPDEIRKSLLGYKDVKLDISVVLGRMNMSVGSFVKLTRGSVMELDTKLNDKLEVRVNSEKIADADLVIKGTEVIAVEVIEVNKPERI